MQMNIDFIKDSLTGDGPISEIFYFDTLDSTNQYAKENQLANDSLVICDYQTKGKGRFNRKWTAEKGEDLTFSLVKNFKVTVDDIQIVNFYTAFIIFLSLKRLIDDSENQLSLKWPNDVLVNRKKVSGILIEIKDIVKPEKKFIIGIGINVNQRVFPDDIKKKATSLYQALGKAVNREDLLVEIIKNFYLNLDFLRDKVKLFELWKQNCSYIGKEILIKKFVDDEELPAVVKDIGNDGGLIVEFGSGETKTYYSGEISLSYEEN